MRQGGWIKTEGKSKLKIQKFQFDYNFLKSGSKLVLCWNPIIEAIVVFSDYPIQFKDKLWVI